MHWEEHFWKVLLIIPSSTTEVITLKPNNSMSTLKTIWTWIAHGQHEIKTVSNIRSIVDASKTESCSLRRKINMKQKLDHHCAVC